MKANCTRPPCGLVMPENLPRGWFFRIFHQDSDWASTRVYCAKLYQSRRFWFPKRLWLRTEIVPVDRQPSIVKQELEHAMRRMVQEVLDREEKQKFIKSNHKIFLGRHP